MDIVKPKFLGLSRQCMVCGSSTFDFIPLTTTNGWCVCNVMGCRNIIKNSVLYFLTEHLVLPVDNIWHQNESIKFYRKRTSRVESGIISTDINTFSGLKMFQENNYGPVLEFEGTHRRVGLANIFYHNPGTYEKICSLPSLIPIVSEINSQPIEIAFNDLHESLKKLISNNHQIAQQCTNGGIFDY